MKKFIISSLHFVYADSYTEGEGEEFGDYTESATIKAENVLEAIKIYIEDILNYTFDIKNANIEDGKLYYSTLVDRDYQERTENELKEWKEGRKKLYSNNYIIQAQEVKDIYIKIN